MRRVVVRRRVGSKSRCRLVSSHPARAGERPLREVPGNTMYVPKKLFFTKGVGTHREKLTSFELALRDAEIACYNLVRVSSISPPNCEEIAIGEGLTQLQPGQIVHVVMSESATA